MWLQGRVQQKEIGLETPSFLVISLGICVSSSAVILGNLFTLSWQRLVTRPLLAAASQIWRPNAMEIETTSDGIACGNPPTDDLMICVVGF